MVLQRNKDAQQGVGHYSAIVLKKKCIDFIAWGIGLLMGNRFGGWIRLYQKRQGDHPPLPVIVFSSTLAGIPKDCESCWLS